MQKQLYLGGSKQKLFFFFLRNTGGACGGLNDVLHNSWLPVGGDLGQIREYGLIGGSILLGGSFDVSKDSCHFKSSIALFCLWIKM